MKAIQTTVVVDGHYRYSRVSLIRFNLLMVEGIYQILSQPLRSIVGKIRDSPFDCDNSPIDCFIDLSFDERQIICDKDSHVFVMNEIT